MRTHCIYVLHATVNFMRSLTLLVMSQLQIVMPPVLQSGGSYDLKWNAQTEEEARLHLPGKGIPAVHVSRLAVPPTYM